MADKNPIGHSVKGSNGRDVHMVRPAVERVGQGREGQDGRTCTEKRGSTQQSERWLFS